MIRFDSIGAVRSGLALAALAGLWLATAVSAAGAGGSGDFSKERAWGHLSSLVEIGPRVSGTEGSERARAYIRTQLDAIGAEVEETRITLAGLDGEASLEAVHLIAVLPGASPDVLMLAAHYDTSPIESFRFVGANDGGSGPALLLELGHQLAATPRAYTIWLVFLDAEALPAVLDDPRPGYFGSRALAALWSADGRLARIRLGFFFNKVADADLRIARDLRSHRSYREILWDAAKNLGRSREFPVNAGFEAPRSSHRPFIDHGLRRVVAIVDNRFGGEREPGLYWHSEDDTLERCSPESLETVGLVVERGLERISARLAKIDRFVSRPFRAPHQPAEPGENGRVGPVPPQ